MDIQLARTFLEIIASGNFITAAKRVHISQSAVSLRVKKLEELLGCELFVRIKSGIELTPAGEQFERYARTLVKAWEDARYQVAVPQGYDDNLIIGCQDSLWPGFGFRWLRLLERQLPRVTLRAEVGLPNVLINLMNDGLLDIGIMYTPQLRPGFEVEELFEDTLVLVSTDPDYGPELDERYIFLDWGAEFQAAHALRYTEYKVSHVTMALGALAIDYVVDRQRAAFLPTRIVEDQVEKGELHIIADAPAFPFPAYAVWTTEKDKDILDQALGVLRRLGEKTDDEQQEVLEEAGVEEYFDGEAIDSEETSKSS